MVYVWLFVCITTTVQVTLKQTKYKLNAMAGKPQFKDVSKVPEHPDRMSLQPRSYSYREHSRENAQGEVFYLRFQVEGGGGGESLRVKPLAEAHPSNMLPLSTYTVSMEGENIIGARIVLRTLWTFATDCTIDVSLSGLSRSFPMSSSTRTVGDRLERMTECRLPGPDILSELLSTPHSECLLD